MNESTKPSVKNAPQVTRKKESAGDFLKTLAYAILIALVFRSFAYEPFHIPSASMRTTLLEGDYIFVSKLSYGYSRYSFPLGTSSLFSVFKGRILESVPKRGDIIVFRNPENPKIDFIKRVIGLPGDTIRVTNGVLFINGTAVKLEKIEDAQEPKADGTLTFVSRYIETLPEGKKHLILDAVPEGPADNTGDYHVPAGHYFFMGDNRDNSTDSRYDHKEGFLYLPSEDLGVGFVPAENLIGRAEIIAFSADPTIPVAQFARWLEHVRFSRFFTSLR